MQHHDLSVVHRSRYLKLLLFIPLCAYFLSYLYLAFYHQKAFLFSTIIHEGGIYTLTETLFYASHFVGHMPVHTVIALYFTGVYLCLDDQQRLEVKKNTLATLFISLILLIAFGFTISFLWFGTEDTMSFLLQKKQSVTRYEQGGSWNLHLPSTMMQFILIPVYIYVSKIFFQSKLRLNHKGWTLIFSSLLLCFFITWLVNEEVFSAVVFVWQDPRYLAHSVRELLTFTITYYPVALYFFIKNGNNSPIQWSLEDKRVLTGMVLFSIIFLLLFAYQSIVPFSVGVSDLAQSPSFAVDGKLSIPYLLASHYFEHFLESCFFILLSLILYYSFSKNSENT